MASDLAQSCSWGKLFSVPLLCRKKQLPNSYVEKNLTKSVIKREKKKSNIPLRHPLSPPKKPERGIVTLHEVGEEILRSDKREGQRMNAVEGSSLLPVRAKDYHQMSLP